MDTCSVSIMSPGTCRLCRGRIPGGYRRYEEEGSYSHFRRLQVVGEVRQTLACRANEQREELTVDICTWGEGRILSEGVGDICIGSVWILICLVRIVMLLRGRKRQSQ